MEPGFLFALFAVAAVAIFVYAIVSAARRREAAAGVADRLGMTFHERDDLGVTRLPHPIFRMGDTRRAVNLVDGTLRDRHVTMFDYEYTVHRTEADGKRSSSTYRFSIVAIELPLQCPPTTIRRERITTKVANALGFGRDVQFESDEFNRQFEVRSDSQQFAFTLIDPAMMEWLVEHATDLDLQFHGTSLVAVAEHRPWERMEALAQRSVDFVERFPRLVWTTYRKGEP